MAFCVSIRKELICLQKSDLCIYVVSNPGVTTRRSKRAVGWPADALIRKLSDLGFLHLVSSRDHRHILVTFLHVRGIDLKMEGLAAADTPAGEEGRAHYWKKRAWRKKQDLAARAREVSRQARVQRSLPDGFRAAGSPCSGGVFQEPWHRRPDLGRLARRDSSRVRTLSACVVGFEPVNQ